MPDGSDSSRDFRFPRVSVEAGLIVFIALLLSVFGLVIQTSAGQYHTPGSPLRTFFMQAFFLVPALAAGVVAAKVNLDRLRRFAPWIFAGALLLLLSIYVPGLGKVVNGSRRWIGLGVVNLQVSDPAKIALVFVLAHYLTQARRHFGRPKFRWFERPRPWLIRVTREAREDFLRGFVFPGLIIGGVCGLVALEPDLGTMALCAAVGGIMLFLAGGRLRYIVPAGLLGISAFSLLIRQWPNRFARVLSFIDPEKYKEDLGYQLWQALTGFASGGLFGEGLGDGMIYRGFLPEAHTDCVFAVVGEELGFCGTVMIPVALLLFFGLVVSRLREIADVFYFNVCLGSMLFVMLQATINMLVNLGMLPTKGMSLPFISYGGSNLVVMFTFVGLIYNSVMNWRKAYLPRPAEF